MANGCDPVLPAVDTQNNREPPAQAREQPIQTSLDVLRLPNIDLVAKSHQSACNAFLIGALLGGATQLGYPCLARWSLTQGQNGILHRSGAAVIGCLLDSHG